MAFVLICVFVLFVAAGPNTLLHKVTSIVSMGYFIFDFCWCLYHQSEGKLYYLHE